MLPALVAELSYCVGVTQSSAQMRGSPTGESPLTYLNQRRTCSHAICPRISPQGTEIAQPGVERLLVWHLRLHVRPSVWETGA
jgi:hypothetical protein